MKKSCKNCGFEDPLGAISRRLGRVMRFDDYCSVSCMNEKVDDLLIEIYELRTRIRRVRKP